jgi:hypothetical protein
MMTNAEIELNEIANLLTGSQYMDPPDGGSPSIAEQIRRMIDDLQEKLKKAIQIAEDSQRHQQQYRRRMDDIICEFGIQTCISDEVDLKTAIGIRDLEKMALGIEASINFWHRRTSNKMQGHIEYGILGKRSIDNPDSIPVEILKRDMTALIAQSVKLLQESRR